MNPLTSEQPSGSFFNFVIDVSLITVAIVSSLISLSVPCLYYIKKQCRQHPTVLIANISLLESVANFNILLMAYGLYGYQRVVDVGNIFHLLTFDIDFLPEDVDFCVYNYCIYMFFQLLSMSFHLCYAVDLLITIKFPFFSGKKRRKFYYVFSVIFPILTLINSVEQARYICKDDLSKESIYIVPLWFLIILLVFCGTSLLIIVFSFIGQKNKTAIRQSYIQQHRVILFLLVLLWVCPIWSNILIRTGYQDTRQFDIVNIIAFFCIVLSSGIINLVRIAYDKYLRERIKAMLTFKKDSRQSVSSISSEQYLQLPTANVINDQVWNLPLAEAMNEFQNQQIVHNIIQVVCQACAEHHHKYGRESIFRNSQEGDDLYQSIYRNTIVIESQTEAVDKSLMDLFLQRQQRKFSIVDPDHCDLLELKQLCKKKRVFKFSCLTQTKHCTADERLRQKTIHITSTLKDVDFEDLSEVNMLSIKVTSYSHRLFESLRKNDGFTSDQIQKTLDLQKNINNIKKAKQSLGASGSFFFFSYDYKLVIKTISQQQKDRFIALLPYYYDHIRYNDSSLLARTYGIFSIQIQGISKIYFLMMENTFQKLENNSISYHTYDLKGSTVQREVKDPKATVFKDINYFKSPDCFIYMTKENKILLIDQITKDIDMLKKHNIMDYSLLLGVGKAKVKRNRRLNEGVIRAEIINDWRYVTDLQQATRRVYSISIIDYLQQFNMNKKMELWLKKIFKGGGDISSVGTQIYYERFMKFISRITIVFNIKASNSVIPKNINMTA